MLAVAIIVFREVLEAALIISIVMAAATGIVGRNRWIGYGIVGGVAGAGLVAAFAASIAATFAGIGQELLNASILFIAVAMLGWHNIWMAQHGREMAQNARSVSEAVNAGTRPLSALALIAGAAVLREGAETVLFVYSISASASEGLTSLVAGTLVGVASGIAIGVGLYAGLLRIPVGRLFWVTSWMILLLAAGLAAQGAGFLVQADVLPPLKLNVWDTSFLLTETSIVGKILHTLIGYIAQPSGIQITFYVLTICLISLLMRLVARSSRPPQNRSVHVLPAGLIVVGGVLGWSHGAKADFKVRSPLVEYREFEIEHNGSVTFDRKSDLNKGQSYTYSVGGGVTPFWKIELEGETGASPGQNLKFLAATIENTFQLTPQGKYWADLGFFFEFSNGLQRDSTNSVKFGPIVQKELGSLGGYRLLHTLNLFFEREIGPFSTERTGFVPAWQSRVLLNPFFQPGFEIYSGIENLGRAGKFNDQRYNIGPMFAGGYSFAPYGKVRYELGYLFGVTSTTPRGALRWKFEYEIPF